MPYSAPTTVTTGQLVTASLMNTDWGGNITFLANPPSCRVFNNAVINLATSGVGVALTFNSERWDTDTIHDTVTNTDRLTCKTAGLYAIYASVEFAVNATGNRQVFIELNGATAIAAHSQLATSTIGTQITVKTIYKLAVNDYVRCIARQDSTAALNVSAFGNYSPEFGMTWVGLG